MLQAMRNPKVLKWGLWVIMILVIPSFVAFYGFSDAGRAGGGMQGIDSFVKVRTPQGDTRELDASYMRAAQNELANNYLSLYFLTTGQAPDARVQSIVANALSNREIADYAVSMVAFSGLADENRIMVSDEQIERELREAGVTGADFQRMLQQQRLREVEWLRRERYVRRTERAQNLVGAAARVSLLEMWLEYKLGNDQLTVDYVRVPTNEYTADIEPSEEELQTFYTENIEEFTLPERRVFRYVLMEGPTRTARFEISDEQLQEAYEEIDFADDRRFQTTPGRTVRQIALSVDEGETEEEVLAQLQEARERLAAGEDFATMADELTEEVVPEQSAATGGLVRQKLNDDTRAELAERYGEVWVETVAALGAEETSDIFVSNDMYYLARVEAISDGYMTLEEARPMLEAQIRRDLQEQEQRERQSIISDRMAEMMEVTATRTSLEAIAEALELEIQETDPVNADTGYRFVQGVGDISRYAEVLGDMEVEEVSQVIREGRQDHLVVMELAEILPSEPQPFEEVQARVASRVRREIAGEMAKQAVNDMVERVRAGEDLTAVAEEKGFEVSSTPEPFTRDDLPPDLRSATEFRSLSVRYGEGDIFPVLSGTGQFVDSWIAVQITTKQEPDKAEFLEESQQLEIGLQDAKRRALIREYRRDAIEELQAEYDPRYVNEDEEL